MTAIHTLSSAISIFALGAAVILCLRTRPAGWSVCAMGAIFATALMTSYNVAVQFGWAPIVRVSVQGHAFEITGTIIAGLAFMALLFVERTLRNQRDQERFARQRAVQRRLRRAKAEEEAARIRAQRSNHAKSEFLANMSHELRTPLNAIIGFSETMREEVFGPLDNDHYREYAANIHSSGMLLLNIVNDVLDLSKVEAGAMDLDERVVDLSDCVADAVETVRGPAEAKEIRLSAIAPDGSIRVKVDDRYLRQVLLNLLSNAIKFTPRGGFVWIAPIVNASGELELNVTDSGIGIAADDISKVMAKFGQVASPYARDHQGTGLGLPLAKQLMELHGGDLVLESKVGRGTTAIVSLPAYRVVSPANDAGPEAEVIALPQPRTAPTPMLDRKVS